jgi:acyl carrier protein
MHAGPNATEVTMRTEEMISAWLVDYLARALDVDPTQIDPSVPLGEFGMDSAGAVGLAADLSDWLGIKLKESVAFDHPTIRELSAHVAAHREGSG